jgi:trimethylamine:corrinoid methyltransferase-like protein
MSMNWPECVIDRPTVRRMHEAALQILSRTGVRIEHAEILERIRGRTGFRSLGSRVCVAPEKVAAWQEAGERPAAAASRPSAGTDGYSCRIGDRSRFIVDRDGRTVRAMTRRDVIDGAKFVAALADRGVVGTTWGVPTDCRLAMQPLEQFMITAQYAPAGGRTTQDCDPLTTRFVREMNRVYGRPSGHEVYVLSPLTLGGPSVEGFWQLRDGIDSASVGSMPMMGINAPCDPLATFTLAMAECLGAAAILHELVPHVPMRISPHPEPADMTSGAMAFGTPEWELLDLMHRDVHAFYGGRFDQKRLRTTSPVPDARAVMDHTRSAVLGMFGGYRVFGGLGQLSLDEVFSPAMAVLDLEMLRQVRRVRQGAVCGEGLDLDALPSVVDEVVGEGMLFAEHETTVCNLRSQYLQPWALSWMSRSRWLAAGSPDAIAEAHAEVDRLIGQYHYDPPRDVLRDLQAIYERAKAALSARNPQPPPP